MVIKIEEAYESRNFPEEIKGELRILYELGLDRAEIEYLKQKRLAGRKGQE